jgi:hypothetical protein
MCYKTWISNAPEEYRYDGWFSGRKPIAITSRYGQNQPIGLETEIEEEESNNWDTQRDWSKLKYVTVAIATHLRYGFI